MGYIYYYGFLILGDHIAKAIAAAVNEAKIKGIKGKELTPYILKNVTCLTEGKSLESSILF